MADSSLLIISEKLVKPSSPTPQSSKYYKINALDACFGELLINIALFYPKGTFHGGNSPSREELFEKLETSLSETLTYYYPFAGRFMDDIVTIDCNDAGVQVWQVQVKGSMSEILNNRSDYNPWNSVFLPEKYRCAKSLMMIQLSYFDCGGICIVLYFMHRIGDGLTMLNFMNDWATITRGSEDICVQEPIFTGASIIPPPNGPLTMPLHYKSSNVVTQRFVFSNSSISQLKTKVIKETEIKNPTQAEVITAFIFERLLKLSGSFKPSSLLQMINFRSVTIPPLSNQTMGNFMDKFVLNVTNENEITFSKIVTELRKSKLDYMDTHKACFEGKESLNRVIEFWIEDQKKFNDENIDVYPFNCWFRVSFYDVDFGFGKPIFVCQPVGEFEKTTVLIANPNADGVDAFITLKREQMSILEDDKELLAFASVNPTIITSN